jgi:serine/threonine protein kinase
MAPEVICKQIHSFSVDFYAIGIICYEIMMGKRPYYGQNRQEIRDAILSKQHTIKRKDLPDDWSPESADFINKLIQRQPTNRLGHKSGIK